MILSHVYCIKGSFITDFQDKALYFKLAEWLFLFFLSQEMNTNWYLKLILPYNFGIVVLAMKLRINKTLLERYVQACQEYCNSMMPDNNGNHLKNCNKFKL